MTSDYEKYENELLEMEEFENRLENYISLNRQVRQDLEAATKYLKSQCQELSLPYADDENLLINIYRTLDKLTNDKTKLREV